MSATPMQQTTSIVIVDSALNNPIMPLHIRVRKQLACYWIDSFSPQARPVFVRIEQKGRRDTDQWATIVSERFENRGQLPAYTQAREYAVSVIRLMDQDFHIKVTIETDDLV